MNTFKIARKATDAPIGEYILGAEETGTHACYMIYGVLKPGQKGRIVKPGQGHDEIVLAVKGELSLSGCCEGIIPEGEAFLVRGDDECFLANPGTCDTLYIIAGGHSDPGHHH